jgi:glycosyltransferase involved in cell wall biosynthesis
MSTPASIVIPTRARPDYLEVALSSIAPQADEAGAGVLVIDDAGPSLATRTLVERLGARYEPHPGPLGLNVARNTGVQRSTGELVVFVDDDVRVRPGWLQALLGAARAHPEIDVFTGPIEPCLEGSRLRGCGREGPPITSLDLGAADTDTRYAWGANMTIRRTALERVGPFEVALEYGGDEQEWQDRLRIETRHSCIAVRVRTHSCARSRGPPTHGDAPAGASTAFAARRLRVEVSCSRSADASGMCFAAAAPPGS